MSPTSSDGAAAGLVKLANYVPQSRPVEDFTPAVRFCFRASDLLEHPGFCCDGYHAIKIRDCIALETHVAALLLPDGQPRTEAVARQAERAGLGDRLLRLDPTGHTPASWADKVWRELRLRS